jgi:Domain of unknown function (DUF222)/HNH endonuclease
MFEVLEASNFPTEPPLELTPPEDLVEELASAFRRREREDVRIARLLHLVNETRAFAHDGYSSSTALLKHRMSLHPGEAQRLVTRANGLAESPLAALAFEKGLLSGSQVDVLLETKCRAPERFTEDESELVAIALGTPLIRELRKRLDYWLDRVAKEDLADERNLVHDLRSLNLRRDGDMMRINGWVDIESGEEMRARLEPGPPAPGDERSTPARRADLLVDILNGAGNRPGLIVHVSAETLFEGKPGISETELGTFLTGDEISRISCDSNLTRVLFGPDSQPLDVGRTKRLVTPALRIGVVSRDVHCIFPGCDRPASWCDIHHLIPWSEGGPTSLENLVMVCRHHHTLVHEGGWQMKGTPGHLAFYRPDGSQLDADLPPRPLPTALPSTRPKRPPAIDIKSAIEQIRAIPYPRGP